MSKGVEHIGKLSEITLPEVNGSEMSKGVGTIKGVGSLLTSPWRANNDEETINRDKDTLGIF